MTRPRLRPLLGATATTAALLLALAGCGGATSASETQSTNTPVHGGTLNFYDPVDYAGWQITQTLWSTSNVSNNLVDRLTWQDPKTGEIKPWLAKSWEVSDDNLTWTFHLRDGVTFSNGEPVDAAIVAANYDLHGFGNDKLGVAPDQFFSNYKSSKVVDPSTVTFSFSKPNAGFLQVTSIYRTGILAKSYLEADWNAQGIATNLIGSGPFVVEAVDGVSGITLKRREDYNWAPEGSAHQGKAYLERVVYKIVPEASTRVGSLATGEAQIARNIAPYDEETVTSGGGRIEAFPVQGQTNKLSISLGADAPTRDLRVRQALQAATDRTEINQTVLSPSYPIPTGSLTVGTPLRGDGSKYLGYDLAKANALLDQAGWLPGGDGIRQKDGQRLSFTLYVAPFYQVSQPVLELLQSQWRKAGVETILKTPSLTELQALVAEDPQSVVFQQGQLSRADVDVLRTAFDSTANNGTYGLKPDPKLDRLVREQALQSDPKKRAQAVQAIEDHIFAQALVIPLYDETQVFGLAPNVHGFGTEAVARSWLYDTWLSQ